MDKKQPSAAPSELCGSRISAAPVIIPLATPSIAGTKRGIVPKRRFQKGTFVKRGGNWIGMWRVDTLQPDGTLKREQRSQTFLGLSEARSTGGVSTDLGCRQRRKPCDSASAQDF